MVAIAGCSDTQKSAESIGIIGGDDGPTATWMTTQLPWNRFCNRYFLGCVIPAFSITPGMTMENVATKLEQTLNTHGANGNGPVKVYYFTAIDYIPPLQQQTWTNVTVRTLLTDIAKADPLRSHCLWDSEHRIVSFLVPSELSEAEWRELIRGMGETVYAAHYEYAPFGAVTATTNNTAFTAFNVAESNPFRFSSEYTDDALGLVYYNYRHYIPSIFRWTVRDPKNETFALSLFVFVNPRTAAEIGDWIPGPGEPDHAFNHGNDVPNYQQTGNPSGAWGYGPSTK